MPSGLNRLTAVQGAEDCHKGRYADGGGLYLRVSPSLGKSWVFRSSAMGVATESGLEAFPAISLADARERAGGSPPASRRRRNPRPNATRSRRTCAPFGQVADALPRRDVGALEQ